MKLSNKKDQDDKEKEEPNQILQKYDIENIKSKLILQKVFDNLSKKKLLKIIKFSNKTKKDWI